MDFKNSFVAEWYDRTDFFDAKFFLFGSFFAHFFQKWWIKKWPQQKKLVKWKISFFMPINHVQKFMISVHSRIVICPFCIGGSIHLQSPCRRQGGLKLTFSHKKCCCYCVVHSAWSCHSLTQRLTTWVTLLVGTHSRVVRTKLRLVPEILVL